MYETLQAFGILPCSSAEISHPTGNTCYKNPTTTNTVPPVNDEKTNCLDTYLPEDDLLSTPVPDPQFSQLSRDNNCCTKLTTSIIVPKVNDAKSKSLVTYLPEAALLAIPGTQFNQLSNILPSYSDHILALKEKRRNLQQKQHTRTYRKRLQANQKITSNKETSHQKIQLIEEIIQKEIVSLTMQMDNMHNSLKKELRKIEELLVKNTPDTYEDIEEESLHGTLV